MADTQQNVYVPGFSLKQQVISGRSGDFTILKLGINVDKIIPFLEEHKNSKGYVNIDIQERRDISQYGETHNARLNTYKADGDNAPKPAAKPAASNKPAANRRPATPAPADDSDDIPF